MQRAASRLRPPRLTLLAFAYLGGITRVGGALTPGALAPLGIGYVVLDRTFDLGRHYLLVSGILLVVAAVLNPGGIAGTVRLRLARSHHPSPTTTSVPAAAEPAPATAGAPT